MTADLGAEAKRRKENRETNMLESSIFPPLTVKYRATGVGFLNSVDVFEKPFSQSSSKSWSK